MLFQRYWLNRIDAFADPKPEESIFIEPQSVPEKSISETEPRSELSKEHSSPDRSPDDTYDTSVVEKEQNNGNGKPKTAEQLSPVVSEKKPSSRKRMFGPTLPQDLKERLLEEGSSKCNVGLPYYAT